VKKLNILFVLLVGLDIHPTRPRDPPEPITTSSQTPSHRIHERVILFTVERVESIREGGECDGVEGEFGEICADVDSIVPESMPLLRQHPLSEKSERGNIPS
jgi:hypothetical protein